MPALTSIALGAGALGGIAGAAKGLAGTPDQIKNTSSSSTATLAPMTEQQRQLQQASLDQYMKQLEQANSYEQGINSAMGIQNQAQAGVLGILGGQAMQMTPQEQAQIQAIRDATVAQGSSDVNTMLDQRLKQLNQSAGERNVRGQAAMQLQGDALRAAAQQQGDISRAANLTAAQQSMQAPYQRISAMQPFLQQGMSFADQMRLQAMQNRSAAQSPYLLQMLQNERLATATQNKTGQEFTPGHAGSLGDALAGGLGGISSGMNTATNLASGYGDLRGLKWGDAVPKPSGGNQQATQFRGGMPQQAG